MDSLEVSIEQAMDILKVSDQEIKSKIIESLESKK